MGSDDLAMHEADALCRTLSIALRPTGSEDLRCMKRMRCVVAVARSEDRCGKRGLSVAALSLALHKKWEAEALHKGRPSCNGMSFIALPLLGFQTDRWL